MSDSFSGTTMQRPYLLRAMHEWMTDNALTPHIVIDVADANAALPVEFAKDGKLIINVSYSATENLFIDNLHASFDARFGGVSRHLDVPIPAIIGIYARETGQGMIFSAEQPSGDAGSSAAPSVRADDSERPSANADANAETDADAEASASERKTRRKSGPPHLKIIK